MATRFYLPSSGAAAVSPAISSEWEHIIPGWSRRRCVLARTGTGGLDLAWSGPTASGDAMLFAQYVSDPLSGSGTISGTASISIRCHESSEQANAKFYLGAKVVSNDGQTVRGILIEAAALAEFPTTAASRYSSATIASCDFGDGDRIVLEIGADKASTGDYTITLQVRDDAANDLDAASGDTGLDNPWVEFSANLPFSIIASPSAGACYLSIETCEIKTDSVLSAAPGGCSFALASPLVAINSVIGASPHLCVLALPPGEIKTGVLLSPGPRSAGMALPRPIFSKSLIELRDRPRLKPVYLAEITLKNSGPTLYLSDRNITVSGQLYEAYLKDLSGVGDELKRLSSDTLNSGIQLVFRNDKYKGYNYLVEIGDAYPFEGAECVIKETCLADNEVPADPGTLFKGVLDEPQEIDLLAFKCKLSSMIYQKDRSWKQAVIDTAAYPNAYEDVGAVEPIIYGADVLVPALRLDWGAKSTLVNGITNSQTTGMELSDAGRFPSSGTIRIDNEKISYTGKSGNALTGVARGASGTTATSHGSGAQAWEVKAQYDSLLAGHELYSVDGIFAEVDGSLLRVTSGVSAVFEGGRHKLRATEQINVMPAEDIGVDQGSHSHSTPSSQNRYPASSSHSDTYGKVTWTGTDANVRDGSDLTSLRAARQSVSYDDQARITVGWPAYAGPPATKVYIYVTHESYLNAGPDTDDYIKIGGTQMNYNGQKVTQRFDWGTTVPTSVQFTLNFADASVAYMEIFEVWMEVQSDSSSASPATGVAKTGGIVSVDFVARFHAVAKGHKDPDGNYGGLGGLIERPDHVIKHFLVRMAGFSLGDIDSASFSAAGASYASAISGGYKFAFSIMDKITPSELLKQVAFECRSALKYIAGKWYLDYIPDAAPAVVKTISTGELAGEFAKFRFSKTPVLDIANDLTASFKRNYSKMGSETEWLLTSRLSDSGSQTKYGIYPRDLEFEFIRDQAMADHVLARMLLELKNPLLIIEFPVFWEHFDLKPGDTVEIENPLYSGRKFYIEEIKRTDPFRATVRAVEWWG